MHKTRAFTSLDFLSLLTLALIVACLLAPNLPHHHHQSPLTACKSNLKNISTACEMWSTDHKGAYPRALGQLTPNYLKTLPTCPTAGSDTYSESFHSRGEHYTFYCAGANHREAGEPPDYPGYNSTQGLVT